MVAVARLGGDFFLNPRPRAYLKKERSVLPEAWIKEAIPLMEGQLPSAGLSPLPVTGAVPLRPNRAEGYGIIAERFYLRTADHSPREKNPTGFEPGSMPRAHQRVITGLPTP